MLTKHFDCQLEHWPLVRIVVDVPETDQEVLAMLSPEHLSSVESLSQVESTDQAQAAALAHENGRLSVLRGLFEKMARQWREAHPDPAESFEKAWPDLFINSGFAKRFAAADGRQEYFRLYGLTRSCAQFACAEADPKSPAPAAEHPNWTKIRKQLKTHGTERSPGMRAGLLAKIEPGKKQVAAAATAAKPPQPAGG